MENLWFDVCVVISNIKLILWWLLRFSSGGKHLVFIIILKIKCDPLKRHSIAHMIVNSTIIISRFSRRDSRFSDHVLLK